MAVQLEKKSESRSQLSGVVKAGLFSADESRSAAEEKLKLCSPQNCTCWRNRPEACISLVFLGLDGFWALLRLKKYTRNHIQRLKLLSGDQTVLL